MGKHADMFSQFKKGLLDDFSPVINRAYKLANFAHAGQKRSSGDAYMTHPISIMNYLRSMGADENTLVAALLHDTLEDTGLTVKDIIDLFDPEVASIVYFLSKDPLEHYKDKDQRRIVYYHKLEAGFCFSYKVYMLKMVDKLHNLSTFDDMKPHKQDKLMKQALTVFVPMFKKYLRVVPDGFYSYCEKVIADMDIIVDDYFVNQK
jgi:guanosine-3',5'-bis(diphosphate) 3'-pyrophosphohydrolase